MRQIRSQHNVSVSEVRPLMRAAWFNNVLYQKDTPLLVLELWLDDKYGMQNIHDVLDAMAPDGKIVTIWIELVVPAHAYD